MNECIRCNAGLTSTQGVEILGAFWCDRKTLKNTLAACLVGSVLCCGCRNDPPTSSSRPAPAPSAPAEPLPASPASAVIQGRILDSVSRESVPNVNVSISSGAEVVTSADGRFSFDASVAGGAELSRLSLTLPLTGLTGRASSHRPSP